MHLWLHFTHWVILDQLHSLSLSLSLSVSLSVSLSLSLTHTHNFQFISKYCWLYFQSVSKFTPFSFSPHPYPGYLNDHSTLAAPLLDMFSTYHQRLCDYVSLFSNFSHCSKFTQNKIQIPCHDLHSPLRSGPFRPSNFISFFTPPPLPHGLIAVCWSSLFLPITIRALVWKQQNPHWLVWAVKTSC